MESENLIGCSQAELLRVRVFMFHRWLFGLLSKRRSKPAKRREADFGSSLDLLVTRGNVHFLYRGVSLSGESAVLLQSSLYWCTGAFLDARFPRDFGFRGSWVLCSLYKIPAVLQVASFVRCLVCRRAVVSECPECGVIDSK